MLIFFVLRNKVLDEVLRLLRIEALSMQNETWCSDLTSWRSKCLPKTKCQSSCIKSTVSRTPSQSFWGHLPFKPHELWKQFPKIGPVWGGPSHLWGGTCHLALVQKCHISVLWKSRPFQIILSNSKFRKLLRVFNQQYYMEKNPGFKWTPLSTVYDRLNLTVRI